MALIVKTTHFGPTEPQPGHRVTNVHSVLTLWKTENMVHFSEPKNRLLCNTHRLMTILPGIMTHRVGQTPNYKHRERGRWSLNGTMVWEIGTHSSCCGVPKREGNICLTQYCIPMLGTEGPGTQPSIRGIYTESLCKQKISSKFKNRNLSPYLLTWVLLHF